MALPATVRDLLEIRTATYRPPAMYKPTFVQSGLPPFTVRTIEYMRRDPQVRLAMATKLAPFHLVKLTLTGNPQTCAFMGKMIKRFWMKAIPKITKAFWYTLSGGEIIFRLKDQFEFWNYNDVYPTDLSILHTAAGVPVGISIKQQQETSGVGYTISGVPVASTPTTASSDRIRLFNPKGFLYLHKREFGALTGSSDFEAPFAPWCEKTDYQGALHSRKLWFYKNAFSGGIMFHPPGNYTVPETGEKIPYRDLARQAMENSLNGAVWCIEQQFDPVTKQPLWQWVPASMNSGGSEILEYVKHLDNEIMRAMEIPDDVVQQISGTGSYAGRTIPLMAFFANQAPVLNNLFTVSDEQVFRPLAKLSLGNDDYEATMEIDIDRLTGQPEQPPDQFGQDDEEGPPDQQQPPPRDPGQPTQFSQNPIENRAMSTIWDVMEADDGDWNRLGMRVFYKRKRIFQMSQVREPAGKKTRNRSGKESKGGQFTDNPGGITLSDEQLRKHFPHLYAKEQKAAKEKPKPTAKKKSVSKASSSARSARVPLVQLTPQTKADIAKAHSKLCDAITQRHAEANEQELATYLGGKSFDDSEPVDIVVTGKSGKIIYGIEMKTMLDNKNAKIRVGGDARERKHAWKKKNNAPIHTVVIDDQKAFNPKTGETDKAKRRVFYKRGYGAFRINAMHEVANLAELKKLLLSDHDKLPAAAQYKQRD